MKRTIMKRTIAITLVVVLCLILVPMRAEAASYPLVYMNSSKSTNTIIEGQVGKLVFSIMPEFKNEKYTIYIYDSTGTRVASVSDTYYNSSSMPFDLTITVNTAKLDLGVGTYKVEYWLGFYSMYGWHDAPNHYTASFEVIKNSCKGNHNFKLTYVWTEPTCEEEGLGRYECTKCGHTVYEAMPKAHNFGDWTKVDGKTHQHVCSTCSTVETANHTWKGKVTKEATCNETGTKTYTCTDCKTTKTKTIEAAHSYKTTIQKATLTKNGKIINKCTVCGETETTTIKYAKSFSLSTTTYPYDGKVKTPTVIVKDSAGNVLTKDVDYTVTYASGRKSLGTYKVTITMKGNYSGTKTLTFNIKLATPTVKVSNAVNGVKITWNKVAGAKNYKVYKSVYSGGKWSSWEAIKTGYTGTSYTDTTVKSADNVRYTVRAFNGSNSSTFKSSNSIKFLATPTVTATNAAKGVSITWNKITGAKSYIVYKSIYTNGGWSSWSRVATDVTGTSYTDTTVKSGHNVRYAVKAINGNFTSYIKASNSIKFLATPTVKVAKTTTGIKASWNAVGSAKGYIVYRRTYSGGKWSGWTAIKTTTALSFTDTTAKTGVYYQYTVRAYNGNFKSWFVNSTSIKR